MSSFSYCTDEVSIDTLAQNFFQVSGNFSLHNTVKFGSGEVPMLYNVCKILNEFFVTIDLPSAPIPPIDSVTQTGSPENNASYSGVLKNLMILNFITKWSIIS